MDSLGTYLEEVAKYPYLTVEKERELGRRWRDSADRTALDALMGSHLRLVVKIAKGYGGYGLPLSDLISEGHVGLMQALHKFDPDRGFRLATYAMWWIRASIQQYVLNNWSLVKLGTTSAQKTLFFNLRRLKADLQALEEGDLAPETVAEIARRLDVPEDAVVTMNRRLAASDSSLNIVLGDDGTGVEWVELLADESDSPEKIVGAQQELNRRRQSLATAMDTLNERERDILNERRLNEEPLTLQVLSERYGISRERVRQIEQRAFEKVQTAMCREARRIRIPSQIAA